MLSFEGKSAIPGVFDTSLADQRAVEEIAGIELNARLISQDQEIAAAFWIIDLAGFGEGCRGGRGVAIEDIVEIIPRGLVSKIIDMSSEYCWLAEVPGCTVDLADFAGRNGGGIDGRERSGIYAGDIIENGAVTRAR